MKPVKKKVFPKNNSQACTKHSLTVKPTSHEFPTFSSLQSFQIRLLLSVPFGTLPFSLAVFVPQKARSIPNDWSLEIERTRKHGGLAAGSTEAPFRIEGRRGWQESVSDKPGRKGRNGGFDVVVRVVRLAVGVGIVHRRRRVGPRKRIGRSLGAGAEDSTRAGRRWW